MSHKTYTLVTGASSGIGKALATIAAREGHGLILVARNKRALASLAYDLSERYSVPTRVIVTDLSDPESPTKIYHELEQNGVVVDILINNAGFGDYGAFLSSSVDTQLAMIAVNIRALTELTHLFLPDMIARGSGRIMNVGSVASFVPGPMMSVYFATKAYVLSFSEALSEELRGTGVSVTCLAPGSTSTGFGDTAQAKANHSTKTSRVTAQSVAEYGWRAMMSRKTVAIHGIGNRLSLRLVRFLPRAVVTRIVRKIQS